MTPFKEEAVNMNFMVFNRVGPDLRPNILHWKHDGQSIQHRGYVKMP